MEITFHEEKKYSACKSDVGPGSTVHWGEHIFFERTNMVNFSGILMILTGKK
jgi:hypothetical protein